MRRFTKFTAVAGAVAGFGLSAAFASAQSFQMGPGMMRHMGPSAAGEFPGPMAARTQPDDAFAADMRLVRDLVHNHQLISRKVTNLPNGIRTVTESDDPRIAQAIKAHVASMTQRLSEGREFNLFSRTIPVLFENRDKIETAVETTEKGTVVTQTSADGNVVAALQAHATEVDELVREGMVAMMRNMRASMAMTPGGMRSGFAR